MSDIATCIFRPRYYTWELQIETSDTTVFIVLSRYCIFSPVVYVLMVVENDCLLHNNYLFHKIEQDAFHWCFFNLREISHIVVSSVLFSYFRAEINYYFNWF